MKEEDSIYKTTIIWAAFMLGFMGVIGLIAVVIITLVWRGMYNRDKEKIIAETFLYGIVTIGLAWILMFIILGFDSLIDKLWQ